MRTVAECEERLKAILQERRALEAEETEVRHERFLAMQHAKRIALKRSKPGRKVYCVSNNWTRAKVAYGDPVEFVSLGRTKLVIAANGKHWNADLLDIALEAPDKALAKINRTLANLFNG